MSSETDSSPVPAPALPVVQVLGLWTMAGLTCELGVLPDERGEPWAVCRFYDRAAPEDARGKWLDARLVVILAGAARALVKLADSGRIAAPRPEPVGLRILDARGAPRP